jgi:hypothetical protein
MYSNPLLNEIKSKALAIDDLEDDECIFLMIVKKEHLFPFVCGNAGHLQDALEGFAKFSDDVKELIIDTAEVLNKQ